MIRAADDAVAAITSLRPLGFECWQLSFALKRDRVPPLAPLAREVQRVLDGTVVSALGVYGNPLREDAVGEESRRSLREAMRTAALFGADIIGCFAGRVPGVSVDSSLPRFREVWSELAREAEDCGVRIAFENCLLIDPLPQLKRWASRIFHLHGKDAGVHRDILAQHGVFGSERFAWHRLPGLGETDWHDILRTLREAGYCGTIDIEGYHDPVFKGDREIEGQLNALHYLKACRAKCGVVPDQKLHFTAASIPRNLI
jgi:sugar phosphate isomerase/epimerase